MDKRGGSPLATHTTQRTNNMDHKIIHKFSATEAAKLRLSAFVEVTDGDTELNAHLGHDQVLAAVCDYIKDCRWTDSGEKRLDTISKVIDEIRAKIAESLS